MTVTSVDSTEKEKGRRSTPKPCPKCGSLHVHRSHRRGMFERLLSKAGFRIRCCHDCRVRFARLGGVVVPIFEILHGLERVVIVSVIVISILLVGAAVVLYSGVHA